MECVLCMKCKFIAILSSPAISIYFNVFSVAKFANEQIAPLASKMDAEGCMDENMYRGLFDNGVCIFPPYFLCKTVCCVD